MRICIFMFLSCLLAMTVRASAQSEDFDNIWFVDAGATGTGQGTSWENAFVNIQLALAAAQETDNETDLIKVGQGTYRADVTTPINDETASLVLIEDCTLRGGFIGLNDQSIDEDVRDIDTWQVVLSGDLSHNDGAHFSNRTDNSDHIVKAVNVNDTAVLDGFTLVAGDNIDDTGLASVTCGGKTLIGQGGAGLECVNASPTIRNCTFKLNRAVYGGGARLMCGSAKFVNCTFIDNYSKSVNQGGNGGGLYCFNTGSPIIHNCIFSNNRADHVGGGLMVQIGGDVEIANCVFVGNKACDWGGGIRSGIDANTKVINCTIVKNCAGSGGGYSAGRDSDSDDGRNQIVNCIIRGNGLLTNCNGQQEACNTGSVDDKQIGLDGFGQLQSVEVSFCNIEGGDDAINDPNGLLDWSSATNFDEDPEFVDFANNDFRLRYTSPCLNNGNSAALPDDLGDVDENETSNEPIPWDLDRQPRQVNSEDCIDVGAFENQEESCFGHVTGASGLPDGVVDVDDLLYVLNHWEEPGGIADFAAGLTIGCGDGIVDDDDLDYIVGDGWGAYSSFAPSGPPEWLEDCLENCGEDIEALIACIVENL